MNESNEESKKTEQCKETNHTCNKDSEDGVNTKPIQSTADQQCKWALLAALVVILIVVVILKCGGGLSDSMVTASAPDSGAYRQYTKRQEERLDVELTRVNEYALQRKRDIENWYANQLAKFEEWKKRRLEQLDAEKELAKARCYQAMQNTTSETTAQEMKDDHLMANSYITPYGYTVTDGYMRTDGSSSSTTNTSVVGDPAGRYAAELRWIEKEKNVIKEAYLELQRRKKVYLAEVESNARNRSASIAGQKRRLQRETKIRAQGAPGVIDAICFSEDDQPSIIFEGEVYYEGNEVNGFKIRKIYPKKVEFERDGELWVQAMQ